MANCTCQLTDKVDWHTSNKYWACIAQPAWGCSGGPSGYMGWGPSRSCKRGERWPGDWDGRPAPFPPGLPEPPALGTRSPRNFGLPMGNGTLFVLEMPPDVLALVASLEANMTGAADGRRAGRAEKVQPSPQWTHPYHRPGTATRCDWQSWERIMSDADRMGAVNVLMDWCACAGNGIPAGKMVGYRSDKDILAFAWR